MSFYIRKCAFLSTIHFEVLCFLIDSCFSFYVERHRFRLAGIINDHDEKVMEANLAVIANKAIIENHNFQSLRYNFVNKFTADVYNNVAIRKGPRNHELLCPSNLNLHFSPIEQKRVEMNLTHIRTHWRGNCCLFLIPFWILHKRSFELMFIDATHSKALPGAEFLPHTSKDLKICFDDWMYLRSKSYQEKSPANLTPSCTIKFRPSLLSPGSIVVNFILSVFLKFISIF